MKTWIIEPRDPLIVRDGRPFGPTPGARASTLDFPFPSTTTGGVRTQTGLNSQGVFTKKSADALKIEVSGPLLVELQDDGEVRWLAPAPVDALLLDMEPKSEKTADRKRLSPIETPTSAVTSLPQGLSLVGMLDYDPKKPRKRPPSFWYWENYDQWLLNPDDGEVDLISLGHRGPQQEQRVHVKIQRDSGTAEEGQLFQTSGLEFATSDNRRLALAVRSDEEPTFELMPFGGERRLAAWRLEKLNFPQMSLDLKKAIVAGKACRLLLLTPSFFEKGAEPTWLLETRHSVTPKLEAIAVQRPQVVSGWDLAACGPKATRRLAPSGTVLFLTLDGTAGAIETWIDHIWMHNVSDGEQNRLDGFGLAALGVWPKTQIQEDNA